MPIAGWGRLCMHYSVTARTFYFKSTSSSTICMLKLFYCWPRRYSSMRSARSVRPLARSFVAPDALNWDWGWMAGAIWQCSTFCAPRKLPESNRTDRWMVMEAVAAAAAIPIYQLKGIGERPIFIFITIIHFFHFTIGGYAVWLDCWREIAATGNRSIFFSSTDVVDGHLKAAKAHDLLLLLMMQIGSGGMWLWLLVDGTTITTTAVSTNRYHYGQVLLSRSELQATHWNFLKHSFATLSSSPGSQIPTQLQLDTQLETSSVRTTTVKVKLHVITERSSLF